MKHPLRLLVSSLWTTLAGKTLGVLLFLLIGCGVTAYAQNSCQSKCVAANSPCTKLTGKEHAQCVAQCEQKCQPTTPVAPLLDPRCGDRTATGKFTCTIEQPVVTQPETVYSSVEFAHGDIVNVNADGCVQTGGWGPTWKRYVNPTGDGTDTKYHGLIRIPTSKPAGSGLVRIETVIGKLQTVTGTDLPVSQLVLHLGYEDDNYSDNGYYSHDDGNDDQCKLDSPNYGGPAYVTITIYRGVTPDTVGSRFDFDVLSNSVDPNGLPYNPQWSWQQVPANQGQIPSTSLCHEFSERASILGLPTVGMVPYFSDCTDQTDLNSVDEPDGFNATICGWGKGGPFMSGSFVGHLNWFPVTVEGQASWGDHSAWRDDDYTFTFNSDEQGNPLSVNGRPGMHVEFDSDETIDHFKSDEWTAFHQAVDNNGTDLAKQLFDGHTILTGMSGLDGEHDLKSELHPLYAIATLRDNYENTLGHDVWLIFVRNRGDEGYCSSQLWDAGFEDYTFRLPWVTGMTAVEADWSDTQFEGTEGTSGPTVSAIDPPAKASGVYVTFHLGPASSTPFIDGALHLIWTGQPVRPSGLPPINGGSAASRLPRARTSTSLPAMAAGGEDDEVEQKIEAAVKQLSPDQRAEVAKARAVAPGAQVATHRLGPGGPVKTITAPPPIMRISRLHAIKAGPATIKTERDAVQMRALCAAANNAPSGLPPGVCKSAVRQVP
jgi:hypothetical protein